MGLTELVNEHVQDEEDLDTAVLNVFALLLQDEELMQAIIIPLLRHEVHRLLRHRALQSEKDSNLSNEPTANPAADRLAYLNERFFVPGIGFVTWAEATVEHHTRRITYLSDKAQSILDTAARHEEAITQINAAGVKCLGEVHKRPRRRTRKAS